MWNIYVYYCQNEIGNSLCVPQHFFQRGVKKELFFFLVFFFLQEVVKESPPGGGGDLYNNKIRER